MGTARPLPVGLQSQDVRQKLPELASHVQPMEARPSPVEDPPFGHGPLPASVVLMLGGDISRAV